MKILWLCSTVTPEIAKNVGIKSAVNVSWIVNTIAQLRSMEEYEVCLCFPVTGADNIIKGISDGIYYYGFPQKISNPTIYNKELEKHFDYILKEYNPDVIHVWGTEYPHTLSMLKACKKIDLLDKTMISIQGLCSVISRHHSAGLPYTILNRYTLFDILKRENIKRQGENHAKRGMYEIEALRMAKNVIGRTDWDEACTKQINPDLKYFLCNETLRKSFYKEKWDVNKCQRYSIFVSQGYYPIKGLHFAVEAVGILKKEYPDVHLYVGGLDMVNRGWKTSSYGKYIKELIKKYGLQNNVAFLGNMDEAKMCNQYMNSHIFLSASSLENSSNSVGEAMLLGMPVIASDVGGIKNLMVHGSEGFLYPFDEPYMVAYYAKKIFDDNELAQEIGENARKHAIKTHDEVENLNTLIDIYNRL